MEPMIVGKKKKKCANVVRHEIQIVLGKQIAKKKQQHYFLHLYELSKGFKGIYISKVLKSCLSLVSYSKCPGLKRVRPPLLLPVPFYVKCAPKHTILLSCEGDPLKLNGTFN